jgi:hypothetical protein
LSTLRHDHGLFVDRGISVPQLMHRINGRRPPAVQQLGGEVCPITLLSCHIAARPRCYERIIRTTLASQSTKLGSSSESTVFSF